jgi:hypothetical protein
MAAPYAPTLYSPYNGQQNISTSGFNFGWYATGNQSTYRIVISQDQSFSSFIDNGGNSSCDGGTGNCATATTTSTSYWKPLSCSGHTYYWKVRANDYTGASAWSNVYSFKTAGTTDTCAMSYGQSIWNEANRAYNNKVSNTGVVKTDYPERFTYKGGVLVDSSWTYCARFVRLVHNFYNSNGSSALEVCGNYANKGKMRTTGTPAVGAAVCYRANSSNGYAGHIGIANGYGQELGVLSISAGVSPRTSPVSTVTSTSYYWGWVSADDYRANY